MRPPGKQGRVTRAPEVAMHSKKAPAQTQADLFRHVSADKAVLYRQVMDCFATAKRQFRLQLRPDEVLAEGNWDLAPRQEAPSVEEIQAALAQLTEWGNLESQPDTARVASISDFYRARFLYRLSQGGEAAEAGLAAFSNAMGRRAQLQTVALEDITHRLQALQTLAELAQPDAAKVHETLRDLVRVFESLSDNAQAFMAGIGRVGLQEAPDRLPGTLHRRLGGPLERHRTAHSGLVAPHRAPALAGRAARSARQCARRRSRSARCRGARLADLARPLEGLAQMVRGR